NRAVVIGAGMAGLTAAGALADHFDSIVVLERDTLPPGPLHRAGTPQARHAHALLLSGQRALSELFPGFEEDLARAGAVRLKVGLDVRVERPGYDPFPRRDLGWFGYSASRPAIEYTVRHRVEGRTNIRLCQPCRVQEVLGSTNRSFQALLGSSPITSPHHRQKRTRSQGPLLHRHYPASALLRPCPTPVVTAACCDVEGA